MVVDHLTIEYAAMLRRASQMINDWCLTYASELCDEKDVRAAWERISDNGGTLYYIAKFNSDYDELLKQASEYTEDKCKNS
jgi:hypothetical protein